MLTQYLHGAIRPLYYAELTVGDVIINAMVDPATTVLCHLNYSRKLVKQLAFLHQSYIIKVTSEAVEISTVYEVSSKDSRNDDVLKTDAFSRSPVEPGGNVSCVPQSTSTTTEEQAEGSLVAKSMFEQIMSL